MHLVQTTAMKDPLARHEPDAAPAPDEKALRTELAAALENHKALDQRARIAMATAARAKSALDDAQATAAKLQAEHIRADEAAMKRRAKAVSEAIRAGSAMPPMDALPAADMAALDRAKAEARALGASYAELQTEADMAAAEAGSAFAMVNTAAIAVVAFGAEKLARETVACIDLYHQLRDRLNGVLELGEAMGIDFIPRARQAEIGIQLNRQRAATAKDLQLIEDHKWEAHLMGLATAQKKRWAAYRLALMDDAGAQFEAPREQ